MTLITAAPPSLPETPYRGIEPFRYVDKSIFFAREQEAHRLLRLVTIHRGVLVHGDSGSGKSSVVNAGLIPAAIVEGFAPDRLRVRPRRGEEIVVERILATSEGDAGFLPSSFADADDEAARVVLSIEAFEERLRRVPEDRLPLLIFDQFEEFVTLFEEAPRGDALKDALAVRAAILDVLVRLIRDQSVAVKLLFVFREDYLAKLSELFVRCPNLRDHYLRLTAVGTEHLYEIIRGPFEQHPGSFGVEVSPQLAREVAAKIAERSEGGTVNLSEVQIVCLRLWESREPDLLFQRRGVQGLLEDYLSDALTRFKPELRDPAVALLGRMVTAAGTRNVVSEEDLLAPDQDDGDLPRERLKQALTALEADGKLVRRERRHNVYFYEIVSEFLIPWISAQKAERQQQAEQRQLQRQIEEREAKRRAEDQARANKRLRRSFRIATVFAVLAIGFAGCASYLFVEARTQRDEAMVRGAAADAARREARSLALAAQALSEEDHHDRALLLSLEALQEDDTVEARAALLGGLLQSPQHLRGHIGWVESVSFSPDGRTFASGGCGEWESEMAGRCVQGEIRLWDIATTKPLAVMPTDHPATVSSLAFGPAGKTLASGSCSSTTDTGRCAQGEIRLWNVAERRQLGEPLAAHLGWVTGLAYDPDGTTLASAGCGENDTFDAACMRTEIRFWDLATHAQVGQPVSGHLGWAARLDYDPDGTTLASGGCAKFDGESYRCIQGEVRLWNAADVDAVGSLGQPLLGHEGSVHAVSFSPDGIQLLSGGEDGSLLRWDVKEREPGPAMAVFGNREGSLAFSADGSQAASGGDNGTVKLWNLAGRGRLERFHADHPTAVHGAAFSPDGARLTSVSCAGGTEGSAGVCDRVEVRTREVAAGKAIGSPRAYQMTGSDPPVISPDGTRLATEREDGTITVWSSETGKELGPRLPGLPDSVLISRIAFSRDGSRLAAAGDDGTTGTIIVWDVATGTQLGPPLVGHDDTVESIAFSPDGTRLVSGSWDNSLILWDIAAGTRIARHTDHTQWVTAVAFAPDGRKLASGDGEGTIVLRDGETGAPLGPPLFDPFGWVDQLTVSPDGKILASGSGFGESQGVSLWDIASGQILGSPLVSHAALFTSLAFNHDGTALASASEDGYLVVSDLSPGEWQDLACQLAARDFYSDEWHQYFKDEPYGPTCPPVLARADQDAMAGRTERARDGFGQAVRFAAQTEDAAVNNSVCWFGSISGFAEIVLPACERAVALASEDEKASCRDSRGLARARTGDVQGAIDDFTAYVDWSKSDPTYEESGAKRKEWIEKLREDEDPFDEKTLSELRMEGVWSGYDGSTG